MICLCLATPLWAQGFAGLGQGGDGFAMPARPAQFDFPQDHGPHPEYRIEWWYLTATLSDTQGNDYGVQWTLFRSALHPFEAEGWASPQIWMGHAGVTTAHHHFAAERLARGGIGQAGVQTAPFRAWVDDWHMTSTAPAGSDALSMLRMAAGGDDFAYALDLAATGPLIFHGQDGFSVKSPEGQASYYYSQPFYRVQGRLDLPTGPVQVTGAAWLDREWSSQPLSATQQGWDWFSLHLGDGARVMGFGLRDMQGGIYTSATWIAPDGETTAYGDGALRLTPLDYAQVAGRRVPVEWRVELPDRGLDITTRPLNRQSWMDVSIPYWEGPIRFSGTHAGRGYLEMTGY
jgi:predicted secreted hydrolase